MAEEKNLENRIKRFLKEQGCWYVKFMGNSFTKAGTPDILACVNGYFLAIEVKSSRGRASELQEYEIKQIRQAGGLALIIKPSTFDVLKEIVFALKNGKIDFR